MTKKLSFEKSVDTRLLETRLAKAEIGDTVTYGEMCEILGKEDVNDFRHSLQSAIRSLRRDHSIDFGVVRGVGMVRLDDAGIAKTADPVLESVRRKCKRAADRLTLVDASKLANEDRKDFLVKFSVLGTIASVTKRKAVEKITAAQPDNIDGILPVGRTLEAFKGK